MNHQSTQRVLDTRTIVNILKELQEEVDGESKTSIIRILAPFPVFMADVCDALGLSREERDEVLGRAVAFVEEWRSNVRRRHTRSPRRAA